MNRVIHWKKAFFSTKHKLFAGDHKVGELSTSSFSISDAKGKMYDSNIEFKNRSFFGNEIDIIDSNHGSVIGTITFNAWSSKAKIVLSGKEVDCKSDNIWGTKWSIIDEGKKLLQYKSSTTSGTIETNINDPILLLSGLFIFNYFIQMIIIVMVCVIVTVI